MNRYTVTNPQPGVYTILDPNGAKVANYGGYNLAGCVVQHLNNAYALGQAFECERHKQEQKESAEPQGYLVIDDAKQVRRYYRKKSEVDSAEDAAIAYAGMKDAGSVLEYTVHTVSATNAFKVKREVSYSIEDITGPGISEPLGDDEIPF